MRDGLRADGPVASEKTLIFETVYEMFKSAVWRIPEDFLERSHFDRVVKEKLDWTSSPGYPYLRRAPTNRDLFRVVDGIPDQTASNKIWLTVQARLLERDADCIRLFIKAEPHKLKKIEQGRFRLISSVSVVDQIIDHMLFGDFNETLIQNWPYVPNRPGWSQYVGGWRAMPMETWVALDKSGWDWSMQLWLAEIVLQIREMLCENVTDQWKELAQWRYTKLFVNPQFITSGGLIFNQVKPGVMKSGCVNTIADNSIMQVVLHVRASLMADVNIGEIITMGDDTLQRRVDKFDAYLSALGQFCHVKQAVPANEFAGFRFHGMSCEPLYKGKHAFNLLHVDDSVIESVCDSYVLMYHRSSYRDWIRSLFEEMDLKVRPKSWCDMIFDGN